MSLKSFLTGKNLLVSLGLLGVGIVALKMLTGNIPPSRPPASKALGISGGYYDAGNVVFNDDIPVVNTLGYDWNYDEATGMMPLIAGLEGNIAAPGVMNAYQGSIDVHGNRPDIEDFPGQGHHYGWNRRPANAFYSRSQRILSY